MQFFSLHYFIDPNENEKNASEMEGGFLVDLLACLIQTCHSDQHAV